MRDEDAIWQRLDDAEAKVVKLRAALVRLDSIITSYMLGDANGADVARVQQEVRGV